MTEPEIEDEGQGGAGSDEAEKRPHEGPWNRNGPVPEKAIMPGLEMARRDNVLRQMRRADDGFVKVMRALLEDGQDETRAIRAVVEESRALMDRAERMYLGGRAVRLTPAMERAQARLLSEAARMAGVDEEEARALIADGGDGAWGGGADQGGAGSGDAG